MPQHTFVNIGSDNEKKKKKKKKTTFMWFMVGAGVIGQPFLSSLDVIPHKQAW